MISYSVCAHIDRYEQARSLFDQLPIDNRVMAIDRGQFGELRNHDRAWEAAYELAMEEESTWCVVLEDDAEPIPDLDRHLRATLACLPDPGIVSLYTGTGRPPQWQGTVTQIVHEAELLGKAWLKSSELLWGVAVAIPTLWVPAMLEAVKDDLRPYDYRLGRVSKISGSPVFYTYPSMVDHADGPTLIQHQDGQPRSEPRKAHALGVPLLNSEWVGF